MRMMLVRFSIRHNMRWLRSQLLKTFSKLTQILSEISWKIHSNNIVKLRERERLTAWHYPLALCLNVEKLQNS